MDLGSVLGLFVVIIGIVIAVSVFYNQQISRDTRFKLAMSAILMAFLCLLTLIAHNIWIDLLAALSAMGLIGLMFRYFWQRLKSNYRSIISNSQGDLAVKALVILRLSERDKLTLSYRDTRGLEMVIDRTSSRRLDSAKIKAHQILLNLTPRKIERIQEQIDDLKKIQSKLQQRK